MNGPWQILQAAAARWIARLARAEAGFCLANHEVPNGGVTPEISFCDTKAVAQQPFVRHLFQSKLRAQLRLENRRTFIAEIDNLAIGIVAKEISMTGGLPSPCLLDVMSNSPRRYLRILSPITRATPLFQMAALATGSRTAFAHDSIREN